MTLIMFTYQTDLFYIYGAWVFVLSRALHTVVHCTVNHVMTRFTFHAIGVVTFGVMLFRFSILNRFTG
jgi:hypothetical protein